MDEFTIEKCRTKAAYKTKLIKRHKLNLNNIKENFNVISDAKIALVLNIENIEIVVQEHGEIMFKNTEDREKIKKIAEKIYKFREKKQE